ncbi:MAG TPA: hypothetical protein VHG92_09695 [Afifellaceae bacterium]|nr:hypothetical protein [Afifellaceae bacterium]
MMRWVQLASVLAVIAAAFAVFQVKYRADAAAHRVAELQRQVDEEKERLSLLKAEWSFLLQPGRIQGLVERHNETLRLEPLQPGQIGRMRDLRDLPPKRRKEDGDEHASR